MLTETVTQRLRKPCRLHHKSLVDPLFSEGSSLYAYPLRLVWRKVTEEELQRVFRPESRPVLARIQMMVSVPKRKQRRAVDRVLMRRRIREAYRRLLPQYEKCLMQKNHNCATLSLGIVYISQKQEGYELISRKLDALMQKMMNQL